MLYKLTISTPLSEMIAVASADCLCLLEFSDRPGLDFEMDLLCKKLNTQITDKKNEWLLQTERELDAYFQNGKFRFSVPLHLVGTNFERSVWQAVKEIPPGETRTYAQIALAVGKPRAYRAVGRANGSNPVAIIVPCHRLVGSDGKLHGYGGGLWRKEWLLRHEGR